MISAMTRLTICVAAVFVCASAPSPGRQETVGPSVRYLSQVPPGTTPPKFAPGIVSTPAIEINAVFRPDFQEFFFARQVDGVFTLFRSTLDSDKWSIPQALPVFPGAGSGVAVDMAYSADGRERAISVGGR
jgi:hypothetical protein